MVHRGEYRGAFSHNPHVDKASVVQMPAEKRTRKSTSTVVASSLKNVVYNQRSAFVMFS